jgi:hypothetical protein
MLRQELADLQAAVDSFRSPQTAIQNPKSKIQSPPDFSPLIAGGYLNRVPVEPFGGSFHILRSGKVISTSVENTRRLASGLQRLVDRYRLEHRTDPSELDDLIRAGYLKEIPPDPFGGIIALDTGKVRLTLDLP